MRCMHTIHYPMVHFNFALLFVNVFCLHIDTITNYRVVLYRLKRTIIT